MKPVVRSEVLSLESYDQIRDRFRGRVLEQKRHRRAQLGERMSVLFENRDTVLLQIQEMLRTERITQESGIQHEIETYNELVPGAGQLSMTLFIEVDEKDEREQLLVACAGMENHLALEIDGERVPAKLTVRAGETAERTTAVQYYLFDLPTPLADRLRKGELKEVALRLDHPAYQARTALAGDVVAQLASDLAEPS